MTSYYSICPQQQYKLTHDISIENFGSVTDEYDIKADDYNSATDDYKLNSSDYKTRTGDYKLTADDNNAVNDVLTLKKQLSEDDNKNKRADNDVIDSNKLHDLETADRKETPDSRTLETGSLKTSICSKDSGNESDIDHKLIANQAQDIVIPRDVATTNQDAGNSDKFVTSSARSADLERVHERMKALGLRKSFEELCKDQPAFSKEDSLVTDSNLQKDLSKLRNAKKPRRPRKLPEIPPNVIRRAPRHQIINSRSLADELAEADPFFRVRLTGSPSPLSPGAGSITSQPCVSNQPVQQSSHHQFYSLTYGEPTTPGPLRHIDDESVFHMMDSVHQHGQHSKVERVHQHALHSKYTGSHEQRHSREDSTPDSEDYHKAQQSARSRRYSGDLEDLDVTHRGCHKFVPRHRDEMFIEIGDPIYVEVEADDLWCEGINIRSGQTGIFPSAYATDLSFLEIEDGKGMKPKKFTVRFLGSVEVNYHKGNDVITNAINKVVKTRRMTLNTPQPPVCNLEINEYGIKMTDKESASKMRETSKRDSLKKRLSRILSKDKDGEGGEHNLFFSLKNVAFCGSHPEEERYFGFITKHPLEMRFACHVFCSEKVTSTVITDAVGTAFRTYYTQYMAFVHPTEDIYLE